MRKSLGFIVLSLWAFVGLSCDTGPSGPGDLNGELISPGPAVGAAVLEVIGTGIQGFSGSGGTEVFWAPQENPAAYRVIVVSEGGGSLEFRVNMRELDSRRPRSSVISLVDEENRPIPVTGDFRVRFTY